MPAVRFVHTSDLHLGKSFGGYRGGDRLTEARHQTIGRLAGVAREHAAGHVLIAGDIFDVPTPAPATWRQAVSAMAEAAGLTWWLLPGNHDNLREAGATWDAIRALGHDNLRILDTAAPVEMAPGVLLLPAPLRTRRVAEDPSAWMDGAETPAGALRIGLAHGAIQQFGEDETGSDTIAPDRDRRARLDYLALGDWHGQMRLSDRAWYSGTPERDGFKHPGPGSSLVVALGGPGAAPEVTPVRIGTFDWQAPVLDLLPGDDPRAALTALLPEGARRDMLLKVTATGHARLSEASALAALEDTLGPEFCHFALDMERLALDVEPSDLDAIAPSGALRRAAEALAGEAADPAFSEDDRAVASAALRRLHAMVSGAS